MGYKKLAIVTVLILLVARVPGGSASALDTIRVAGPSNPEAPGLPLAIDWEQVNSNGFGDPTTGEVTALEAFNGYLYAGTHNPADLGQFPDGARIFRSSNGTTWTSANIPGFNNPHDTAAPAILDFVVFGSQLYASTGRGNAAQIWRYSSGTTWSPMVAAGFGDPEVKNISALAVYNNALYAGATNQTSGAQIYRSFTGDNGSWGLVAPAPATLPAAGVTGFAEFGGVLYAAVESEGPVQIWSSTGGAWTAVVSNGFGDSNTDKTGGMAVFGGYLYVGAGNAVDGAQLWRTNGMGWAQPTSPISVDPNNQQVEMVSVFENYLYVSVKNTTTGIEVWRTADLVTWEQANLDGFGDSNNTGTNRSHASANFLNQFYVGTSNIVTGGELWRTVSLAPTDIMLSNNTVNENQSANTIVGGLSAASPKPAPTFTFSLACAVAGTDDASFNILGTNLRTSATFNYETKSTYNICLRVTDQDGLTYDENFVIAVNNVNEPPTNISLSNSSVNENQSVNTVIGALTATDPDAGATFTYSLACAVAGADDASFNILGSNLRTSAAFNFETKSTYSICIRVRDQGALTYDKNFVVTVINLNEAPTNISLSPSSVNEHQPVNTVVGALTATDPDASATFTYSLACAVPGVDDATFNILGANLRTSAILNYEAKATYSICIRVTDQGSLTYDKGFTVNVNNIMEIPPDLFLPLVVR